MKNQKLKLAFIVVLYKTPVKELERLKNEIKTITTDDYKIYTVDNTNDNKGFAYGVNKGIRMAQKDDCSCFVVLNPDISLLHLRGVNWLKAMRYFDIFGLAMEQNNKIYYGGVIDRLRLTGSIEEKKPKTRFIKVDFVSGSFMVIKINVINKIDYFDESYFMYYEDVDYCKKAIGSGFKVGIDSDLVYSHFENSKFNKDKEKQLTASRWRFFFKHSSLKQKLFEMIRLPKTLFEILLKRKFLLSFLSFNFSSFFNKFLNFILFIFLVKYLKVEEYGIYNLIWAQTALFTPLVDLGTTSYGLVYLPTEKNEKFKELFNLRLVLSVFVFILTVLLSFFMLKKNSNLIFYTFLVSFTIFSNMFSGSYMVITSIREKLFQSSILSMIFNLILISFLVIALVIGKNIFVVFLIIFLFYNLYSVINYLFLKNDLRGLTIKLFDKNWLKIVEKSYLFVLISVFASLYFKIDLFLLNYLKGARAVAIYSAGYKFLEALIFIAASYTISATPILARLSKKIPALIKRIKRDGLLLFILGLFISIVMLFTGPVFLPYILKNSYQPSIAIAQIVSFALPFIFINTIFYNLLYIFNRAYLVVYLFIFQFMTNFLLNLWLIPQYSYFASAYLTVFSEIINTIISFIFVYEHIRRRRQSLSE